jgi:hypothetical protein
MLAQQARSGRSANSLTNQTIIIILIIIIIILIMNNFVWLNLVTRCKNMSDIVKVKVICRVEGKPRSSSR